jgi:phenylpropionate dioxygenase-like ring-hydroxylating dioxygenase large terminal subunit
MHRNVSHLILFLYSIQTLCITTNCQKEVFHALIDSCPHKKVALSEGRITSGSCSSSSSRSDTHLLQCSYHGWTFDGYDGKCVEIPQTLIAQHERGRGGKDDADAVNKKSKQQRRQDATSVAVTQAQGMVWLQPSKSPLEALNIEGPPRIPELDMDGYKATVAVRDFPIDWTVLMENIMGK